MHESIETARKNWIVLAATGAMTALLSGGISFGTASNVNAERDATRMLSAEITSMQEEINELELELAEERHARSRLALVVQMTHPTLPSGLGIASMTMSIAPPDYSAVDEVINIGEDE